MKIQQTEVDRKELVDSLSTTETEERIQPEQRVRGKKSSVTERSTKEEDGSRKKLRVWSRKGNENVL